MHTGDTVVLVVVMPRLNGSPGELVLIPFLVEEDHRGYVLDTLITRLPRCDIDRTEDFHFEIDRWILHCNGSVG